MIIRNGLFYYYFDYFIWDSSWLTLFKRIYLNTLDCESLCISSGLRFALLKYKNEIIKFLINYRVSIVMMFIFLFWLINYSEIESRMRVFIYLSGEIFLTLIFSFIIYIHFLFSSRQFFRWLGKNSAEMILKQSLVLHLWKNSILSMPNNVLCVILCLITRIILIRVMIPLYDRVRGIVNCHLLLMSKYK